MIQLCAYSPHVVCHMRSHSVTYHLRHVNAPRLTSAKICVNEHYSNSVPDLVGALV